VTALAFEDALAWARETISEPLRSSEVAYADEDRMTLRLVSRLGTVAYLKLAPDMRDERDRLAWAAGKLLVAEVLGFRPGSDADWLLTSGLSGEPLSNPEHTARPERLVIRLADALHRVHALDPHSCPFGEPSPDDVVVHGDACLPNFLATDDELTGYVDLGDLCRAPVEIDLAAAVWSLQYNLGPGWGAPFLAAYGWPNDEETVEALRQSYD